MVLSPLSLAGSACLVRSASSMFGMKPKLPPGNANSPQPGLGASLGGTPAPEPKRAVKKNMIWVILIVLGGLLFVAKLVDDVRKGTFTADYSKQPDRNIGDVAEKNKISAAMKEGVDATIREKKLSNDQVQAAINAPPSLTAAQAVAAAQGMESNRSGPLKPAYTPTSVAETTQSKTIDPNAPTPGSLIVPSSKPDSTTSKTPNFRANNSTPASSAEDAAERDAQMKKEQEIFSIRTSPLFAAGSSSGASSRSSDSPQRNPQQLATDAAPVDPVSAYLQSLSKVPGGAAGAGAQNSQAAWLAQQKNDKQGDAVFSAPAIPGAVLLPGNIIKLVTRTVIRSDLEGDVLALVTEDVYDSVTSKTIVIPKGSKVAGTASSELRPGQERALTAFKTLYFPDGRSFDLRGSQGSDAEGAAGLQGDVDRRLFRKYGSGLLLAAIAYAIDRKSPSNQVNIVGGSATQQKQTLSEVAGTVLADTTKSYIEQQRQVQDLLTIPSGQPFTIIVKSPLVLVPSQTAFK